MTASATRPDVNHKDRTTILAITRARLDAVLSRFEREHDPPPIEDQPAEMLAEYERVAAAMLHIT
ncbi:hypothetical protein [Mycobacterium sp.]|uniref:hypothetical protein n=1 Tax=Mycobacterium sp. TaxID=1785 RepID=UPI003F9D6174